MQLNKIAASSITFEVISYTEDKKIHSVKRFSDGQTFTIGDYVTNGTKMQGKIEEFELFSRNDSGELTMYVTTDWSKVGMGLDDIQKTSPLPSQHQIGHYINFQIEQMKVRAEILSVHFYEGKVKYDLELKLKDKSATRIYNVDSVFVVKP